MITIDYGGIQMHDLLEKLGKDIVHEESPNDPGKRSRLWFYEDVEQVLTESTGTKKIIGIKVNLPEPAEITLNPECFRKMVNLEIFINRNASLWGHISYLPNTLRLIKWDRCQLQSLPSNFQGNHLVEFNMPRSHIRQLEGFKNMPMLTSMNLSGCQFLEKIPDLSRIPNIKDLNLSWCTSLVEVDDSVGRLDKLVQLNLRGCVRLTRFATRLRLKSLETLYLSDCERLESFPEIEVEMESLWILHIRRSGIRELPSSIAYLTGLDTLEAWDSKLQLCPNLSKFCLKGCSQIRKLERFKHLPKLTSMNLSGCQFLEKIPDLSRIPNIKDLNLSWCTSLVEVDDSVGRLDKLVQLNLRGCVRLTRFATRLRLKSLETLYLSSAQVKVT
ncbi:protein SUPPRESSOR OF npr1-1, CONSTITUTIVE 1-like [Prunus avium]|uniref:Protein SUPPRESSOR OF npr1-1, CONSTITUTIVE 1-like n=1 Tax=Prunus avium TaxID=42229 RepID=A0A6P5TDN2_PRUAV|nr:protein SUPPRESSOR OF npr1-1, CONSTITUTIVE 1-like [Prunus avium]